MMTCGRSFDMVEQRRSLVGHQALALKRNRRVNRAVGSAEQAEVEYVTPLLPLHSSFAVPFVSVARRARCSLPKSLKVEPIRIRFRSNWSFNERRSQFFNPELPLATKNISAIPAADLLQRRLRRVEHLAGPMRGFRSVIQWWSATLTFRYGVVVPVDLPFYVEIGRRPEPLRLTLTLQVELGMAVGLSRTSITNIELGNQQPSLYTFVRICVRTRTESLVELLRAFSQIRFESRVLNDVPEVTRETLTNLSKKALSGAGS